MKNVVLLLLILFASCEAPKTGVSEEDSNTFEKNVETLKNDFVKGYEEGKVDKSDFDKLHIWHEFLKAKVDAEREKNAKKL